MSDDKINDAFRAYAEGEAADPMPAIGAPGWWDWSLRSAMRYSVCMQVLKISEMDDAIRAHVAARQAAIDDAEVARLCEAEVFPES